MATLLRLKLRALQVPTQPCITESATGQPDKQSRINIKVPPPPDSLKQPQPSLHFLLSHVKFKNETAYSLTGIFGAWGQKNASN